MRARHLRLAVAFAAALAATACQNAPPVQKLPPITFTDRQPFRLDVAELEILSDYQPPGRLPNIEHLMPVSPGAAIERWAQDRLRPMGQRDSGSARVVIRDARVVEVPLRTDTSLSGAFKKEQELRYDATLQVAVEILDARHMTVADVVATAQRSRTVPEGLTVNERERIQYEITDGLARDIDRQMEQLIRNYLGRWLIR
ncbi:hypothetical protein [Magnetospirillum fulvum]|uniref:Lipoprotein n=1 Tax=Magnetospirillum fulvum MGU-K5 TaxID=1316936 RepID=S9TEL3_MAGFU|nr:hypothetical protein [Magnetospirillum fulvum]EPY00656.1 hypothetical protein K678_14954 [Magnetospirillum fulvum MGU-K5]